MCNRASRSLAALAATAALALPFAALGGAQKYEVLSASVRATLAQALSDRTPVDLKDLDTRAWVRGMTRKVQSRYPDEDAARNFLAMVRYESMRAGLDPHLVLAVIDVESKFRKYAVSKSGARGLKQGQVEYQARRDADARPIAVTDVVAVVAAVKSRICAG